jgi:hypothetical protein
LLLVLMVIVVASGLGMTYLNTSSVKLASSVNLAESTRASYIAGSAVEHGMHILRTDPGGLAGSQASPLGPFSVTGSNDSYTFWAASTGYPERYLICGDGTAGSFQRKALVEVNSHNDYDSLIYSLGPMCYWRMSDSSWVCWDFTGYWWGSYENGPQRSVPGALVGTTNPAVKFDGVNDYVDLGGLSVSGNKLTIVAWIRRSGSFPGHNDGRIVSKATGTHTQDHYWMLSTREKDYRRYLRFRLRTGGYTTQLETTTGEIKPHVWHLAAAVYDGSRMRLYVDGVQVASTAKSGNLNTNSGVAAWIGGNPPSSTARAWSGEIDEVALFAKALSATDLVNLYNARYPNIEVLSWDD